MYNIYQFKKEEFYEMKNQFYSLGKKFQIYVVLCFVLLENSKIKKYQSCYVLCEVMYMYFCWIVNYNINDFIGCWCYLKFWV